VTVPFTKHSKEGLVQAEAPQSKRIGVILEFRRPLKTEKISVVVNLALRDWRLYALRVPVLEITFCGLGMPDLE
jgi:hypothetical protein